jgi:hypothetical protein
MILVRVHPSRTSVLNQQRETDRHALKLQVPLGFCLTKFLERTFFKGFHPLGSDENTVGQVLTYYYT